MKKISIVIPAYNEQGNIPIITEKISTLFDSLKQYSFEIIFVNDGSSDATRNVLNNLSKQFSYVKYIHFSKNFGHQLALKAGIDKAKGDAVINMDGDLQHPVEVIPELLKHWENGYDIVYTLRKEDEKLSYFKRTTSNSFYKILNKVAEINLQSGEADFRLYDKKVSDVIRNFQESEPFLRGLFKWIGFKQIGIEYMPHERFSGVSKYTLKKMLRFAIQGITSFSIRPLYLAVYLGFFLSLLSLLYIPYIIYVFLQDETVSGWVSTIMLIIFFSGIQISILGVIGIYLGKLFLQSKNRPNYIIDETNLNL